MCKITLWRSEPSAPTLLTSGRPAEGKKNVPPIPDSQMSEFDEYIIEWHFLYCIFVFYSQKVGGWGKGGLKKGPNNRIYIKKHVIYFW